MSLQLLWTLLSAIPDLIKLLQAIENVQKEAGLEKKVTDDLKVLHTAYAAKDGAAITALFSGSSASVPPASP